MAINHAIDATTIQRLLLISERFLLSQSKSVCAPKQAKRCVPSLRTCTPLQFTSEWIDPPRYRIDHQLNRIQGASASEVLR